MGGQKGGGRWLNHCSGKATNLIEATYFGVSEWAFRGRLDEPRPGRTTAFAGRERRLTFNRSFWERLNDWALNFDDWANVCSPATGEMRRLDWFGEVGSMACNRPSAAHNRARGLDLCQIRFTNGERIDMNASHQGDLTDQRLYLASVASLRRSFGTVLSCWYNDAHRDHLHVDDLTVVHPIRSQNRTDTTLIQAAACLLDGAQLTIDGIWDTATEAAYRHLLEAFDLEQTAPRQDVDHGVSLLTQIMRAGLSDVDAGSIGRASAMSTEPGLVRDGSAQPVSGSDLRHP